MDSLSTLGVSTATNTYISTDAWFAITGSTAKLLPGINSVGTIPVVKSTMKYSPFLFCEVSESDAKCNIAATAPAESSKTQPITTNAEDIPFS